MTQTICTKINPQSKFRMIGSLNCVKRKSSQTTILNFPGQMVKTQKRRYGPVRVYISGPLHHAADLMTARCLYEHVASIVTDTGHEPYVPHWHTDPETAHHIPAVDVYRHDVKALSQCDMIIAHVGAPSTGVGAELVMAVNNAMTVIGIAGTAETVSRFAEGFLQDLDVPLVRFADPAELRSALTPLLAMDLPTWTAL
jgi:2'-deoxynucleoside 5'-phosphate N-hydrolase